MKFQFGSNIIWDSKCENSIKYKSRESLGESTEEMVEPEFIGKDGGEITNSAEVENDEETWELKFRKFKLNLEKLLNASDTKQPPNIITTNTTSININKQVEVREAKGEKGDRGLTGQCSCDDYCAKKIGKCFLNLFLN